MTNQRINPQELIPEYWHGIYVPTEEKLIFLGKRNLEYLKQYWRRKERELAGHIKALQSDIDMLDGKTVEDIEAMAAQYEHPEFPRIGVPKDAWDNDPEPLDGDSINREPGATTFNFCGWCKHCGGGSCRHGYHITTYCPLIPRQLGNGETWGSNEKFRFNTPCAIANGTQELLDTCVEHLKAKQATVISEKSRVGAFIRYITRVMQNAEDKPYLASHRPHDWFNIGDKVMCLIGGFDSAIPEKVNTFVSGKVINGYRHHDGCVSVCADEQVHSGDYCDGCGLGYGMSRPEVLLEWEYEYLKTHPDYLKVWIRCSKADLSEFNSEAMSKAFTEEVK